MKIENVNYNIKTEIIDNINRIADSNLIQHNYQTNFRIFTIILPDPLTKVPVNKNLSGRKKKIISTNIKTLMKY